MSITFAIASVLLAGSPAPSEAFDAFFSRALSDSTFLLSRVAPDFSATEEITWYPEETHVHRPLPCSYTEIESAGWSVMPSQETLDRLGIEYSNPRFLDATTAIVVLGAPEGEADAEYHFKLQSAAWSLTHLTVISRLESGTPLPPAVCAEAL